MVPPVLLDVAMRWTGRRDRRTRAAASGLYLVSAVAAGLHLLARMREAGQRIPVVYYHGGLGHWRTERAAQARAAGAFGETVFPDELFALVAGALAAGTPT